jgi:hypothetical protein
LEEGHRWRRLVEVVVVEVEVVEVRARVTVDLARKDASDSPESRNPTAPRTSSQSEDNVVQSRSKESRTVPLRIEGCRTTNA